MSAFRIVSRDIWLLVVRDLALDRPLDHGRALGPGAELIGAAAVGDAQGHSLLYLSRQRGADGTLGKGRLRPLRQADQLLICEFFDVHVVLLNGCVEKFLLGLAAACEARQGPAAGKVIQRHGLADLGQAAAFAQASQAPGAAVEGEGDQGVPLVCVELGRQRAVGRVVHRVGEPLTV